MLAQQHFKVALSLKYSFRYICFCFPIFSLASGIFFSNNICSCIAIIVLERTSTLFTLWKINSVKVKRKKNQIKKERKMLGKIISNRIELKTDSMCLLIFFYDSGIGMVSNNFFSINGNNRLSVKNYFKKTTQTFL